MYMSIGDEHDKHKDTKAKINEDDLIESARSTFNNID